MIKYIFINQPYFPRFTEIPRGGGLADLAHGLFIVFSPFHFQDNDPTYQGTNAPFQKQSSPDCNVDEDTKERANEQIQYAYKEGLVDLNVAKKPHLESAGDEEAMDYKPNVGGDHQAAQLDEGSGKNCCPQSDDGRVINGKFTHYIFRIFLFIRN